MIEIDLFQNFDQVREFTKYMIHNNYTKIIAEYNTIYNKFRQKLKKIRFE